MGDVRTSNSKDIILQHHDARMPTTIRPSTRETLSTAYVSATAWTRSRAWAPVTVVSTTEETPATAWVPATPWTSATAGSRSTARTPWQQREGQKWSC